VLWITGVRPFLTAQLNVYSFFSYFTLALSLALEVRNSLIPLGWAAQKGVNTNPGLKVSQSIDFSCINIFFTAYVSVLVKGIAALHARKARVLVTCTRTLHAVSTHLTCKYTKMRVITCTCV